MIRICFSLLPPNASASMAPIPNISTVKVGHIDDVQELRRSKPTIIPERFVRDMTERPSTLPTAIPSSSDIPTIDFSKLSNGNIDELRTEISQLATACKDWGFFQVHISLFNPRPGFLSFACQYI